MSTSNNEIEVKIDFDKGLDIWNDKNQEKRKKTRDDVYENQEVTKATIQNWKIGKVPKGFITLFSFLQENNLNLSDIATITKDGKSIL